MSGAFTRWGAALLAGVVLALGASSAFAAPKAKPPTLKLYVLTPNFSAAEGVGNGEREYVRQVLIEELHGLPWFVLVGPETLGENLAAKLDACQDARAAGRLLGARADRLLVLSVATPKRRQFVMSVSFHGANGQTLGSQSETETAPDELKYAVPGLVEKLFAREIAALSGAGGLTRIEESVEITPEKEAPKGPGKTPLAGAKAAKEAEPDLSLDLKDAETLVGEAKELIEADETTRAEDLLRRALKSGDCPLEGRLYLARILCESGRREEALPLLRFYLARETRPEFVEDKRRAKLLLTGF